MLVNSVTSSDPNDGFVQERLRLAGTALSGGRSDEAEEYCNQALAVRPQLPPALYLLAICAIQQQHKDRAIELLRRVVAIDPNGFEPTEWLANLLREAGEFAESKRHCQSLVRLRPNSIGTNIAMGLCLVDEGSSNEAIPFLRKAIKQNSQIPHPHFYLGRALRDVQLYKEAEAEYRKAISLSPDEPATYEALGILLMELGRRAEGIELFLTSVNLSPSVNSLLVLSDALTMDSRVAEAERYGRQAVELDPKNGYAHESLGCTLQSLGRFKEAANCFQTAIALNPSSSNAYLELFRAKRISESDRETLEHLELLASQTGRTKEERRQLHYSLGKGYDDLRQFDRAFQHFKSANQLARQVQLRDVPYDVKRHHAWFDGITKTFTDSFFMSHQSSGSNSERPVFIVGMIRSGTTLVEQILASHSEVWRSGETLFWSDQYRTALTGDLMNGQWNGKRLTDTVTQYLTELELPAGSHSLITDKNPRNYVALGLIHLLLPNAKIIHCRRSPIDTCMSIYTTPFRMGAEFCYDPSSIVAAYREYQGLMEHWRRVLPPTSFIEVDYEDLVSNREIVVRELVDFCGLEWDDACLRHEENQSAVLTPSVWQVRQSIYTTSVDRWRNYEPWLGEFSQLLQTSSASYLA